MQLLSKKSAAERFRFKNTGELSHSRAILAGQSLTTANASTGNITWDSVSFQLKTKDPIINETITTAQTSSSLNSLYPSTYIGTIVIAPNIPEGAVRYEKINHTTWISSSVTIV